MKGQAYNVGLSSANLSKTRAFVKKIQKEDSPPLFTFTLQKWVKIQIKETILFSNEKLESLGWAPSVSLEEGIGELVHLYDYFKGKINIEMFKTPRICKRSVHF